MARDRRGVARIRREAYDAQPTVKVDGVDTGLQSFLSAPGLKNPVTKELRRIDRDLAKPRTPEQELSAQAAGLTFAQLNRLRFAEELGRQPTEAEFDAPVFPSDPGAREAGIRVLQGSGILVEVVKTQSVVEDQPPKMALAGEETEAE